MEFSDKVAIITGVAGGIGLATATMLGEQGATVIGWDFQEERLEQAKKALQARNIEMTAVNADLENINKIRELFARTVEDFKRFLLKDTARPKRLRMPSVSSLQIEPGILPVKPWM
jgi:NAD(P)-dependent dehydrogenase (short-subunit alcohol dehydrogenase family)